MQIENMTELEAENLLWEIRISRKDSLPIPERGSRKLYTAKTDTIFSGSSTPLIKWFELLMVLDSNKGISSYGASKIIQLRPSTIWSLRHRIKRAYDNGRGDLLDDIVKKIKELSCLPKEPQPST